MADESGDSSVPADRGAAPGSGPPPWAEWLVAHAGRVFMIGFGVVWLVGLALPVYFIGRLIHKELRQALAYRPNAAVITKYAPPKTEVDEFDEVTTTPGLIEYAYTVAGEPRAGKYTQGGTSNQYSRALAGPQKVGRKITAYYDPREPDKSTLEPVADPQLLGFLIFMMPFLAVGVTMIRKGLTGKGPKLRLARGGKGAVSIRGGGAFLGSYFILSAIFAFSFFFLAGLLPWQAAWAAGPAIMAAIPLASWRIARFAARRARLKAAAKPPAPPAQPQPQAAQAPAAGELPKSLWSPRKKLMFFVVFAVFWCGITGVFVGMVVRAFVKQDYARRNFLTTTGEVIASKVDRQEGDSDSGPTYAPLIKYRYSVNGKVYTSRRYAYGAASTSDRGYAADIVARHPKGARVTVYYDAADPAESVLSVEVPRYYNLLVLALQPFVIAGLGLIASCFYLPMTWRRERAFLQSRAQVPWDIPTWGVLRQEMGSFTIKPKRRLVVVLLAAAGAYWVVCLVSTVLLAFMYGVAALSLGQVWAVVAVAAGAGLLAAIVAFTRSSRDRLHVDRSLGRVTVTRKKQTTELAFDQVRSWAVRPSQDRRSIEQSGRRRNVIHAPELVLLTVDEKQVEVHTFGAGEGAWRIAARAVEGLAELTGKPFEIVTASRGEGQDGPQSLGEAVGMLGETLFGGENADNPD
jgi:hypothetical protein